MGLHMIIAIGHRRRRDAWQRCFHSRDGRSMLGSGRSEPNTSFLGQVGPNDGRQAVRRLKSNSIRFPLTWAGLTERNLDWADLWLISRLSRIMLSWRYWRRWVRKRIDQKAFQSDLHIPCAHPFPLHRTRTSHLSNRFKCNCTHSRRRGAIKSWRRKTASATVPSVVSQANSPVGSRTKSKSKLQNNNNNNMFLKGEKKKSATANGVNMLIASDKSFEQWRTLHDTIAQSRK